MNNIEIAQRARVAFDAYVAATERLHLIKKAATQGTRKRGPRRSYREFISEQEMRQMAAGSELRNLLKLLEGRDNTPDAVAVYAFRKARFARIAAQAAYFEAAKAEAQAAQKLDNAEASK